MANSSQPRRNAQAKVDALRRQQQVRSRRRRGLVAAAILIAVVLGGGGLFAVLRPSRGATPVVSLTGVQTFKEDRNHVTGPVTYPQTPPAGGDHNPTWLNCGIYTSPVPNENGVHDLEHGAVWVTYRPDLPKADVAALTRLATGQPYLDLSPYPGLPAPVVVSAWGVQLRLTGVDDPRLAAFVKKYKQGPQTPEPGAPCTGGVGTPTG